MAALNQNAAAMQSDPRPIRKIIHVDMDAFYASVEQRDNPELRGKPLAVGGGVRGVVAAASYEARKYGIHSAMPAVTARRRCPDLIFVKPRFEVYKAVSAQIRAIFAEHTPIIEPLSLDEAYLDVTENLTGLPLATDIAKAIRARIREETGLTASAGVSYNKFLAKLASDQRKPDGLYVIPPDRGAAFVEGLPIGRFHGVGPATEAKMLRLGISTGADLRERLFAHFQRLHFAFHDRAQTGQLMSRANTDLQQIQAFVVMIPLTISNGVTVLAVTVAVAMPTTVTVGSVAPAANELAVVVQVIVCPDGGWQVHPVPKAPTGRTPVGRVCVMEMGRVTPTPACTLGVTT